MTINDHSHLLIHSTTLSWEMRTGLFHHLIRNAHLYTTHLLKWEWIKKKREWLFLVIYTLDMHYTTHSLKLGMDQRREKEGVVIPSHLYIRHAHLHNSPAIVRNASEKRKREWLLLVTFDTHISVLTY